MSNQPFLQLEAKFVLHFRSSIERGGSGAPCTKNIPHLHVKLPQFCMYAKHARPTCRITPILHVCIWRWGVLAHLVRKTYHIYMQNYPNFACFHLAYTRGLGLLCNKKNICI